jgi:NTP pyrophosphatase (non-canonical NTP hydrolase)
MENFGERVKQLGNDRNLIHGSTPEKQFEKLLEEIKELKEGIDEGDFHKVADGIGDCSVVLGVIAAQYGMRLEGCCEVAWEQIKDRKGRMVDGVFVKDSQ